jgi:hypothetical protein
MKKLLLKALYFGLFFLLFSVVVNGVFLLLIARTDWDFVKRLESLRWEDPRYEVLILGTSLAEYGIDTEFITSGGIASYNLAVVGSSIKTNYVQLEEYLTLYPYKPKYVILAMNSYLEEFNQEGIQPVIEFTMKGHRYGMKDVPISKFNWAGMELLKKLIKPHYRKMKVAMGQKRNTSSVYDHSGFQELYLNIDKYESAKWLGEIARLCDEYGVTLLVVEIPGVKETQNLSDVGPYLLHFGNGHSAALYNFNAQDFCTDLEIEEDWGGLSHFNWQGARKFTEALIARTPLSDMAAQD